MGRIVRYQERIEDGKLIVDEIHKVVVHRFNLGDVDDPEIYAAGPLYDWEKSDAGQFVMEHSITKPTFQRHIDYASLGYSYIILAELEKKKLSEFYLRWGKNGNK